MYLATGVDEIWKVDTDLESLQSDSAGENGQAVSRCSGMKDKLKRANTCKVISNHANGLMQKARRKS
eukprot:1610393-Prymnesium_polylepis.1